jgi:hypothetical protein
MSILKYNDPMVWDIKRGYKVSPKCIDRYKMIDDKVFEIHRVIVYRFTMGDVEDPDLYAAQPLMEWQESEMGKWIMERSVESPVWHKQPDVHNYGWNMIIEAYLKGPDHTFWQLKWGNEVDRNKIR